MSVSEFCIKTGLSCIVLGIALSLAGWIGSLKIWRLVAFIGIIAMIWEC